MSLIFVLLPTFISSVHHTNSCVLIHFISYAYSLDMYPVADVVIICITHYSRSSYLLLDVFRTYNLMKLVGNPS